MAKADRAAQVRRRVAALGPRARTTRIPRAVRDEIVDVARGCRAAGTSWRAIAAELGVSAESVRRWTTAAGQRRRPLELIPVRVPLAAGGRAVTLVSPRGYRVEGLGVEELEALLRRLA